MGLLTKDLNFEIYLTLNDDASTSLQFFENMPLRKQNELESKARTIAEKYLKETHSFFISKFQVIKVSRDTSGEKV